MTDILRKAGGVPSQLTTSLACPHNLLELGITFFSSLNPAIQAAIIGSLTTVLTGLVGFGVLLWRLGREAQRAIDELKAAEAMRLKLRIYEQDVVKTVDKIVDAEVALSGVVRRFESDLTTYRTLTRASFPAVAPVARVPALIGLKSAFDLAAIGIVTFVEQWLVVDPRFSIFQTAINAASYDVTAAWGAYFDRAMRTMPIDLPAGPQWTPPDDAMAADVIAAGNALINRLQTVGAYATDFRTEMQSVLVGPLFGNVVARRQPIDPQYVVITLVDADTLARCFEESPWGQNKKATEKRVRAEILAQNKKPDD